MLFSAAATTEAATAAPPLLLGKNNTNSSGRTITMTMKSRSSISSRRRKRRRDPPSASSVETLPSLLLLRRPQPPPPPPPPPPPSDASTSTNQHYTLNVNSPRVYTTKIVRHVYGEQEEEEKSKRSSSRSPSDVLRLMDALRVPVDADLYLSLLTECAHSRDALQGATVHAHILHRRRPQLAPLFLLIGNRLLLMYGACCRPHSARQLFDQMPTRDAISWKAMMAAFTHSGSHMEALRLFVEMMLACSAAISDDKVFPDAAAIVLHSCVRSASLGFGKQLHGLILKIAPSSRLLGSPLIQLYGLFGCLESARKLLDAMPAPDAPSWTSMIAAYCRRGRFKEALLLFKELGRGGASKSCRALSSALAACAEIGDGGRSGAQVHAAAIKAGTDSHKLVISGLVNMYGRYGLLADARRSFDVVGTREAASLDAMPRALALSGFFLH